MKQYIKILCLIIILTSFFSCSTTKSLGEGEQLYVGVKKMNIVSSQGAEISSEARSEVKSDLSVKPNNPLISPYIRTPFPFGLLVYTYCHPTKDRGFKHWFYDQFAKEPVLISSTTPQLRMKLIENKLQNMGYFNSNAEYEILPKKRNPQKAKISYTVDVAKGWKYDEIFYPKPIDKLTHLIDSLKSTSLLKRGAQYNTDTLNLERDRITSELRNKGYYYFRSDYLRFLADTTQNRYEVDVKMVLEQEISELALRQYKVGKIDVYIESVKGVGEVDTLKSKSNRPRSNNLVVTYQKPKRVKMALIRRNVRMRTGKIYSFDDQKLTQTNLSRTGVFSKVQMIPILTDTLNGDTLNFRINLAMGKPIEAEFGVNLTSKSNSFLGPGADFSISHNNLFGGAEKLTLKLNGAYEWQTGANHVESSALMNSYEFGARVSLTFPRLLLSKNLKKQRRFISSTKFDLGASILNRPKYFRMFSLDAAMEYNFSTSKESSHMFNPYKLVYNKLLNTSQSFEETLNQNPAIALSFRDQFIPMMRYAYTYTKTFGGNANKVYMRIEATQAGNLIDGVARLCGVDGEKKLFGNQFSQFVKGQLEFKYSRKMWGENWLVSRFLVGAGHAYSNSKVMPYSEQFYIGGANSIRAFTVRSIGPGSYRPNTDNPNYYFDQTANFKLEANLEFRLKIYGGLQFALFLDAGNIWLLQDDPVRPGGKLEGKTFFKDIALGTGCGIRYDLSMIVLRLDLGVGIHAPYDTGKRGYYNMTKFKDSLGLHFAIGYPF